MPQAWKTVRVFISSTFRDMHAERDYLVKVVFPELRERMAKRRLHLVDLDLRWGVTEEEAERGKVLEIILEEIDRSRPFFIAILGERYGSVPDKVPEDTEFVYPWLRDYSGHSLTALEVVHGVLRNPELARRSFFYFRDPQFISQIPEKNRADFVAENPEAARKVAVLKEKIRASGRPVMENYPCSWDDREGRLVDLDDFGQRILDDLWTAICEEYPEEAPEVDPLAIERQMHEAFAEERSRFHVGRTEQAAQLTKYVQGTDRRPIVITGESGCGKSAFLASWYLRYAAEHPDDFVLAYFIGASPDSTNYIRLLRNMCEELKRKCSIEEQIPMDDKKLLIMLSVLVTTALQYKARIVIIIDAIDQLNIPRQNASLFFEQMDWLRWLLNLDWIFPREKVRLIVSVRSAERDRPELWAADEIKLPPLNLDEQRQIISAALSAWRRKLDERQLAALLAHQGVQNPLYLSVALEELRFFGSFEKLTERIKALAEDIPGLFEQVLERWEKDHGRWLVAEAFALLGSSRYGLSEPEMLDLLRPEDEEQLPRVLWARLARSATKYLVKRGELLGFFHQQFSDAVSNRYPSQDDHRAKLAAYFKNASFERKLDEYPYQLHKLGNWQALAATLNAMDFINYARNQGTIEIELYPFWRELWRQGVKYANQGKYAEAVQLYECFISYHTLWQGCEWLDTIALQFDLANLYIENGQRDKAIQAFQRALTILERHPLLDSDGFHLANLRGRIYHLQGNYSEALPQFKRALAIQEKHVQESKYPEIRASYESSLAEVLNNLANLYLDQGKYEEAVPLYKRALAVQKHTYGNGHREVGRTLSYLSTLYWKQGKYSKASKLLRRALRITEIALGPDHPVTKRYRTNLEALQKAMR